MKGSKGVFRFEGFVEGTKLPDLHWAVNGIAVQLVVQPAANASIVNGQVVEAAGSGADVVDVLRKWLADNRHQYVGAPQLREFQRHIGRSEAGYSALINRATKHGVLAKEKKGQRGVHSRYFVVGSVPQIAGPKAKVRAHA